MPTIITGSPNITLLSSKIIADLCAGYFYIDLTPSVFLPGGAGTSGGVQGANVRVTNPLGVVIKQYSTSGFDIYPPMTSVVSVSIPTTAGNYLYGTYTIDVKLTDEDGTEYTVTKSVNICPPDSNNKNKKYGCLNADIKGNCVDGKVVILLNQPPNYKGTIFTSQVIDMDLEYPTSSGLPVLQNITYASFSVVLFEGEYILTGTSCVLYSFGDNVFYKISYHINCHKNIKCIIDLCCVQSKWDELAARLDSDCTTDEKEGTMGIIIESQFYVNAAQGAANCGADPSDWINKLELLLGCVCTCNCNEGTPIIDNTPATDYSFEGCGFDQATVGLTKVITLYNYGYKTVLANGSGAGLTLSEPALDADNCQMIQTLNYTAPPAATQGYVYRGLLTQAGAANPSAVVDSANTVTIAWTRTAQGIYRGTLSGTYTPLTANNTFCIASATITNCKMSATYESASTILVTSTAIDAAIPQDNLMTNTPVQLSIF